MPARIQDWVTPMAPDPAWSSTMVEPTRLARWVTYNYGVEVISRAKLIEPTKGQLGMRKGVCWSPPTYAGKRIFARNDNEIVCANLAAVNRRARSENDTIIFSCPALPHSTKCSNRNPKLQSRNENRNHRLRRELSRTITQITRIFWYGMFHSICNFGEVANGTYFNL